MAAVSRRKEHLTTIRDGEKGKASQQKEEIDPERIVFKRTGKGRDQTSC